MPVSSTRSNIANCKGCVCLSSLCTPRIWNQVWHIVDVQLMFIGWMDGWWIFICLGVWSACSIVHISPSPMSCQMESTPLLSHHPFNIPGGDLIGMIQSLISQVQEPSSGLPLYQSPRLRARIEPWEPKPGEMRRLHKPASSFRGGLTFAYLVFASFLKAAFSFPLDPRFFNSWSFCIHHSMPSIDRDPVTHPFFNLSTSLTTFYHSFPGTAKHR